MVELLSEKDKEQVAKCLKSTGIACATLQNLVKSDDALLSVFALDMLELSRKVQGRMKHLAEMLGVAVPEDHQQRQPAPPPQADGSAEGGSNTRPYPRKPYGSR